MLFAGNRTEELELTSGTLLRLARYRGGSEGFSNENWIRHPELSVAFGNVCIQKGNIPDVSRAQGSCLSTPSQQTGAARQPNERRSQSTAKRPFVAMLRCSRPRGRARIIKHMLLVHESCGAFLGTQADQMRERDDVIRENQRACI